MSASCNSNWPALTRLAVVMVTYGDRYRILQQVVQRVIASTPAHLVIVYNGNYDPLRAPVHASIVSVERSENHGSAGGFCAGIDAALQLDAEYFLLLDDDNLPEPDCLDRLFAAHSQLGGAPLLALQAFRPSQPWQRTVVHQGVVPIGQPNTYGWFNIINERYLLRRQLAAGDRLRELEVKPAYSLLRIGIAAYGGLFVRRQAFELAERPDPRYFCYYDDLDFTDRLVRRGVSIHLCADAVIHDLDTSWHARDDRAHPAFSAKTSDLRIFLDLRNAFIFYRSRINNRALYALNGLGFWSGIAYLALFRSSDLRTAWRRLILIRRAVHHGSRGVFAPCDPCSANRQSPGC